MRAVIFILLISYLNAKEVYATFNVVPQKEANLAFNISGIVEKVNVDVGSIVKKGELLAKLKSSDAKANVQLAKVELEFAKKEYLRAKRAGSALDRAKQDMYEYKYKLAKAKLDYVEAIYKKSFLRAPFSGVITAKFIEVGDGISAMPPKSVLKLESLHNKKLILEFDQKYWQDVKVGDLFKYSFDADNRVYSGEITKIYPTINPQTRKAKAEVDTLDIPSGLFGVGKIIVGK